MIFQPKLFSALKNYSKQQFLADLKAGIIVGVVALPLAIAFGIASGVTPEKGLYSAIIAGFIVSLLGGSRVQISGPTGAFIIIVSGIIQDFGMAGLAIATIIAGIMLVAMGFLKLGSVIKFIPYPVVVGFTSGIALSIFATQIKDFFGLQIDNVPTDFIYKWGVYFRHFDTINFWSLGIGIATILIIAITPKISKKIPGLLVAIILVTVIVYFLRNQLGVQGIETIGDRFFIDPSLPKAEAPPIDFKAIQTLLPTAFTIAMLCAIVTLLSATVADGALGDKHDSNTELIAQGIANVVTPFFGGIPSMGAIARTMTNINNGGRTPIAGIVHAVVLLLIVVFLGGLTKHIPVACLAGVLVVVSYNMSDWRSFKALFKNSRADIAVLLTTFILTVAFDLTIAIEIGLLLAVVLFIKRTSETATVSLFKNEVSCAEYVEGNVDTEKLTIPNGIEVYEIEGPFFFGIANKFEEVMKQVGDKPNIRIIRMRKVPFIDSTGVHNLESLIKSSQKENITILLSGVNPQVHQMLKKTGIEALVGSENVCSNINEAVARAVQLNN
ncbi:sulfate permease [Paludibacter sp. 221]|uniref:SulP family inorganic anion transporter n=1 Tax=Paludibacter sp. 221 TaxID=2302939 RepID=UPI0013D71902|nr:sulfate permease [Paludibacter sp. 221]NDV45799.1 sulfate permease [Paludibacter sp. 221]